MVTDTIAHDINNLLMIVSGCCERLAGQTALTPAQAAELERISLATNQASWLTSQLVPTARGAITSPDATDLADALGRAARLLEQDLGEHVRIDMRLSSHKTWVPMSDGQVSQVLTNLVLNARDAMPRGGVIAILTDTLTLDATAAATHRLPPGYYVDLEVRDTGSGMTSETRARAFDRFFTTKAPGKGTGLGLASVKRVVEWCGGTIDLRSIPGRGTRFTMLLPLVDEPKSGDSPDADEQGLRARPGEAIMVVEDDPVVRDIVASILSALGYETFEAASATEALARASSQRLDLVITDLDLPDLHGGALAARLEAAAPGTKVLFMSGYGDETSLPSGVHEAGAFLQKPFTSRALGERVRALIDDPAIGPPAGPR
jgi:two-component system, cell cycle sensor histidine kinase and response regulator CckA